ncbi:hypothetical protein EV421DRAFT_2039028 [Armillaria borealis]|uniref:DUF6534 domain-containing protein n=1 Tax=Armillaria borealis TaxID=47425 RepID=A0AA39MI66_9AGAR|nr:hypothetical protein EV421DRAFT_2039028 [Armillaria borealis]
MNLQPSTAVPSIGETFGALYVGTTIAAVLFGITNLQTVIYYKRYPNDWWLYRYSVALLWVLDTLHVVLSTHALYFYLIEMFGDLSSALVHNIWSFKVQLVINVVIVVYVPGLYAIRLWKLGRHFHKILPWFVFLAMASSLGAGIFIIYEISMTPNFSAISDIKTSIYAIFSTVAATDFSIALMMCYYLHKSRVAMNISTTACRVLHLMRLVTVSGLATRSACLPAFVRVICANCLQYMLAIDSYIGQSSSQVQPIKRFYKELQYIAWPESLIFLGIVFILPKLYVNSLLAMFNHRPKHQSNKSNVDRGGHSASAILQFAPHTTAETDVSIPPSEIQ